MKITTCTINVGKGEGNRNMALDVLGFVDVFFILDCPVDSRGNYVEHENRKYEMVSTVENGDVEVYIRSSIVGWFTIESHKKESVIMRYEEEDTKKIKRIGGVYLRPLKEVQVMEERMKELTSCDLIIGDLNARNPIWGKDARDKTTNSYGRRLQRCIKEENRSVAKNTELTFRQTTVLDIAIYKKDEETPRRSITDKCGFEHVGQIVRVKAEKPKNLKNEGVAWKKVDWKGLESSLKEMELNEDGGWKNLKKILEELPKARDWKNKNGWWTVELERMAKDARKMRREGNEGWKTARSVLRNEMFKRRYESMKC